MNHQQVRDIAEAAFKSRFSDVDIVSINVKPGFDRYDDPMLDVRIVYDAEVERLIAPDNAPDMVRVRSEIVEKVWAAAEDSPGYPFIHFIAKSDLEEDGGRGIAGGGPSREACRPVWCPRHLATPS